MKSLAVFQRMRRKYKFFMDRLYDAKKIKYLESLKSGSKIIILGNQKTGSTAIADLVAKRSGVSVTLDMQSVLNNPVWILENRYCLSDFSDFIFQHREEFDRHILKEPSFTFFYNELVQCIPNAKYAFIVRNPFDNIRSILNRLKIPGDLESINIDDWPELSYMPTWKLAVDSTWLGCPQGSYIEALAHRWCVAADVYFNNKEDMYLIKYEEFLSDKMGEIDSICRHFELSTENDISGLVDNQYQKKGKRGTDILQFFGAENYNKIKSICEDRAEKFGYHFK